MEEGKREAIWTHVKLLILAHKNGLIFPPCMNLDHRPLVCFSKNTFIYLEGAQDIIQELDSLNPTLKEIHLGEKCPSHYIRGFKV